MERKRERKKRKIIKIYCTQRDIVCERERERERVCDVCVSKTERER